LVKIYDVGNVVPLCVCVTLQNYTYIGELYIYFVQGLVIVWHGIIYHRVQLLNL